MTEIAVQTGRPRGRLIALDGLRGLASLIVVFGHLSPSLPIEIFTRARFSTGPFGLLVNGEAAVHVFFVLSGFVLSGSLRRRHEATLRGLPGYLARRVWRLHPPYLAGVLLAWAATSLYPEPGPRPETRFIEHWGQKRITLEQFLPLVYSLPNAAYGLLPVGWTLWVESIFSGLLPLMVLAQRLHFVPFALVIAYFLQMPLTTGWSFYALDFALGVSLAAYCSTADARSRLATTAGALAFVAGVVLLQTPAVLHLADLGAPTKLARSVSAAGAALTVAGVLYCRPIENFLSLSFFRFLGRVSYSLYLVHVPVILVIAGHSTAQSIAGMSVVFVVCVGVSLALATVMERFVEAPSQQIGRRLASAIDRKLGVK